MPPNTRPSASNSREARGFAAQDEFETALGAAIRSHVEKISPDHERLYRVVIEQIWQNRKRTLGPGSSLQTDPESLRKVIEDVRSQTMWERLVPPDGEGDSRLGWLDALP